MYDHYIALDWAQRCMAVARMPAKTNRISIFEGPANVKELQVYLSQLQGKKILTFEESTGAHWLYAELRPYVDRVLVCDPVRNKLLSEGAKTDKIDSEKLVRLLKADLLKEVFHDGDALISIRRTVSAYADMVRSGTRLKNQRAALFRGYGQNHKSDQFSGSDAERFVLDGLDRHIALYQKEKNRYEDEFERLNKIHPELKLLQTLPGIGLIGAVKILAIVVDAKRFPDYRHFLSYCGLVKHDRISGGRLYGKKNTRYCRAMKEVFKTGAIACIRNATSPNEFRNYYLHLMKEKNYPEFNARHALARKLAKIAFGILKSKTPFQSERMGVCKQSL